MKTLITIAGTLLAGATPFAASAALGHEAATTQNTVEAVALQHAVQAAEPRSESDELAELRRAIAELRAEKERLHAELMVERVSAEPRTERWVEAVDELARSQYEAARKEAAETDRRNAEESVLLELERIAEHPHGLWTAEAPGEGPDIHEVQLDADESRRWRIVTERGSDAAVEVLVKQLEAEPSKRASKREARRFVVDGKTLEVDTDSYPEGIHGRHVVIQRDGDRRFGVLAVDPEEGPHEVQVEEQVWVGVDGDTHRLRLAPQTEQRRAFIRDFQDGDVDARHDPRTGSGTR